MLDEAGRPIQGKSFLSSFTWGYGRVLAGALAELAEFPVVEQKLRLDLEKMLISQTNDGDTQPLNSFVINTALDWLVRIINFPRNMISLNAYAVRVPILRKSAEVPEPELLNSFFIEDLARVRSAFRQQDVGQALSAYVLGRTRQPRQDVVPSKPLIEATLVPSRTPFSRWPGPGRHPLVLMQQVAVNHAVEELRVSGLVGVNGPPGTGKTTLLRDVVANVLLERAVAMAKFNKPVDAFKFRARMELGQGFVKLYDLDEGLLGHEIVVASSNNKAIENVSREIPSAHAVADDLDPPLRYFASIADCLAANGQVTSTRKGATWGLVAAALGNASNRYAFTQAFWWHKDWGLRHYLQAIAEGWSAQSTQNGNTFPPVVAVD